MKLMLYCKCEEWKWAIYDSFLCTLDVIGIWIWTYGRMGEYIYTEYIETEYIKRMYKQLHTCLYSWSKKAALLQQNKRRHHRANFLSFQSCIPLPALTADSQVDSYHAG